MSLVETIGEDAKRAQALEDSDPQELEGARRLVRGQSLAGNIARRAESNTTKPRNFCSLCWIRTRNPPPATKCSGSSARVIDKHKPMQDLALKMYEHSLEHHAAEIYSRGSEFEYTLANRACQLMKDMGRKEAGPRIGFVLHRGPGEGPRSLCWQ